MKRIDLAAPYSPIECALHICRYLPAKEMVAGKKVLDIACGEGLGVGHLLEWGAAEIVGVDLSQTAISVAERTFFGNPKARFVCADALGFLANHAQDFDIIISVETVEHLPDPGAFFEALAHIRRKGTSVIVSCPNDYLYYGRGSSLNPHHLKQYSFYDFRTLAERYLGKATWYLGAPNSGFAAIELNAAQHSAGKYVDTFAKLPSSLSEVVPATIHSKDRLKPSTSLFYLGIWSNEQLSSTYQTSFPASSHFRLPRIVNVSGDVSIGRTHRIAYVIDQHGWAFDNIVKNMQPYLDGRYNITYYYLSDYADRSMLLHDVFVVNSYDNVHFMWRESLFQALSNSRIMLDLLSTSKLTVGELAEELAIPALTTSVYDHLFLREEDIDARHEHFALVDGYATSSLKLQKAYRAAYEKKPEVEISDGVNLKLFAPSRAAQENRELRGDQVLQIGWVGNSSWGKGKVGMGEDPKGLHTILVPAIERLVLEGYAVNLALADRNIRKRNRSEMVTYYGEIDILVCSSSIEGTPNPVLEAMASGVPFISTDVGIVGEVAGPLQANFIIKERTAFGMYKMLKRMLDDPGARTAVAAENLESILNWDWSAKTTSWLRLFAAAEASHKMFGRALRQTILSARLNNWQQEEAIEKLRKEQTISNARIVGLRTKIEKRDSQLRNSAIASRQKQQENNKLKSQNILAEQEIIRVQALVPLTRKRIQKAIKRRFKNYLGRSDA